MLPDDQIPITSVRWLWPGWLARGAVNLLDGDPGVGKSTIVCDIAAAVTTGGTLPDGSNAAVGDVVYCSADDSIENTLLPRFMAAGGDRRRITFLEGVQCGESERGIILPDDLEKISQHLAVSAAIGRPVSLAVIDPLMAFLSAKVDSHRDSDIRGVLAKMKRVAEDHNVCFVVIGSSIGIIGAARSALLAGFDPDDESLRVLSVINSNAAPPSLSYAIRPALVPNDDNPVEASLIEWRGTCDYTTNDIPCCL